MEKDKAEEKYMKIDEEGRLVPDYDQTIKLFKDGDIVSGKVVRIDRDEVLVDIGYKSEGVVPLCELSLKGTAHPEEVLSLGDEIEALVLQKEDAEGRLILSKKRAQFEKVWKKVEEIAAAEGTVKGKVMEVVKGGLILDIGVRGFLPASLVELRRVKDLKEYLGKVLECKIIETNRYRNNVVLSRKALLEDSQKKIRQKILAKLEKGQLLTGKISNLANFGAFVDLGGIDGLIHISELSWSRINHPSEVVSIGDEVKVQVLEVDKERGRVSLGLKQTQEDPWKTAVSKHSVAEIVKGKVVRLASFGAFVGLGEGLEGLVHLSELSEEGLKLPEQAVKVEQEIEVKIIEIDLDRRRISLSLKQAQEAIEEPETKKTKEPKTKIEFKKEKEKEPPKPGSLEAIVEEMKKDRFGKKENTSTFQGGRK